MEYDRPICLLGNRVERKETRMSTWLINIQHESSVHDKSPSIVLVWYCFYVGAFFIAMRPFNQCYMMIWRTFRAEISYSKFSALVRCFNPFSALSMTDKNGKAYFIIRGMIGITLRTTLMGFGFEFLFLLYYITSSCTQGFF